MNKKKGVIIVDTVQKKGKNRSKGKNVLSRLAQKVTLVAMMLSCIVMQAMPTYATTSGDPQGAVDSNTGWSLTNFFANATKYAKKAGGWFIILLGVIMIIVAAWQIGSGFIAHGRKQTNWFIAIALLIVGGAFAAGGFTFVSKVASGGQATLNELGSGNANGDAKSTSTQTILPMFDGTGQTNTILPLPDGTQLSLYFD